MFPLPEQWVQEQRVVASRGHRRQDLHGNSLQNKMPANSNSRSKKKGDKSIKICLRFMSIRRNSAFVCFSHKWVKILLRGRGGASLKQCAADVKPPSLCREWVLIPNPLGVTNPLLTLTLRRRAHQHVCATDTSVVMLHAPLLRCCSHDFQQPLWLMITLILIEYRRIWGNKGQADCSPPWSFQGIFYLHSVFQTLTSALHINHVKKKQHSTEPRKNG